MIKTLLLLFWIFFKIGLFTFGGGYAMIPMMQTDLVNAGLITPDQLANFMAIAEITPGAFAINVATFTGVSQAGILGGVIATLGLITPSIIIILIIAAVFSNFSKNKYVQNILKGIRPVVIGLITAVSLRFIYSSILPDGFNDMSSWLWPPLIIIPLAFFLKLKFKKLNSVLIILICAALGMLLYSL